MAYNGDIQVHLIGQQGNVIKVGMAPRTTVFNDMEVIKPGHTIVHPLNVYRLGTDKSIIYVAATRKVEAINIAKQVGHEVKKFLGPKELYDGTK